jgi:hypothetical protein
MSGPPELPGLMAASVWMKRWNCCEPAARGAHDSERDAGFQAKRRADGDHRITHLDRIRVADLQRRQRASRIDLDDREIRLHVRTDQPRTVFGRIVRQLHLDVVRFVDDVVICDDVAVLVNHKTRAGRLATECTRIGRAALSATIREEPAEKVHCVLIFFILRAGRRASFAGRWSLFRNIVRADVDYRGLEQLRELGYFIRGLLCRRDHERRGVRS